MSDSFIQIYPPPKAMRYATEEQIINLPKIFLVTFNSLDCEFNEELTFMRVCTLVVTVRVVSRYEESAVEL